VSVVKQTFMLIVVKVLAGLITIVGVGGAVRGVVSLSFAEQTLDFLQTTREAGFAVLPGVDLETFRYVAYATWVAVILWGLLSAVSGVGMYLMKNWARILFLVTLVLPVIWTLYSIAKPFINQVGAERIASNFFILLVCVGLFYFFSRRKTKDLFVRNSYAA
jgi:hypothetical protein